MFSNWIRCYAQGIRSNLGAESSAYILQLSYFVFTDESILLNCLHSFNVWPRTQKNKCHGARLFTVRCHIWIWIEIWENCHVTSGPYEKHATSHTASFFKVSSPLLSSQALFTAFAECPQLLLKWLQNLNLLCWKCLHYRLKFGENEGSFFVFLIWCTQGGILWYSKYFFSKKDAFKQEKPAFPAEPASPDLQCYVQKFFSASSVILFLLYSVFTALCSYWILFFNCFHCFHCFFCFFCKSVTWHHLWCHLRHL